MGDNLDSDLLYEDFQENDDRKEFNVNKFVLIVLRLSAAFWNLLR